jgi:hypothetical protein
MKSVSFLPGDYARCQGHTGEADCSVCLRRITIAHDDKSRLYSYFYPTPRLLGGFICPYCIPQDGTYDHRKGRDK